MGIALFTLSVGLVVYFYGGYMVKNGREADRKRGSRWD